MLKNGDVDLLTVEFSQRAQEIHDFFIEKITT